MAMAAASRRRLARLAALSLVIVLLVSLHSIIQKRKSPGTDWETEVPGRQLLEDSDFGNCTPAAIDRFPRALMSQQVRVEGGLIVHVLVSLFMFLALALVCDDYFVPALESICDALHLKSDVAGATFMAAGSSAPELATAVIAVFITEDDIGVGAVVGSAVFNIMVVVAVCGLFTGTVLSLNWWPIARDCFFYLLSIFLLLIALYDRRVTWVESSLLLMLYVIYCGFMFVNEDVEVWVKTKLGCQIRGAVTEESQLIHHPRGEEYGIAVITPSPNKDEKVLPPLTASITVSASSDKLDTSVSWSKRIISYASAPLNLLFYLTIPDCRKPRWRSLYLITFIMSMVWISLTSYVLVWMIAIIGFTLSIPDTVMGLTFLAAGVSLPDAITSLIVSREGKGDMAVSNAIGSNVFDILLCLGLPWFLQTACIQPGSTVRVFSKGLAYSTVSLLSTVVFFLATMHYNQWKLNRPLGWVLLVWYFLFMTLASMYELNVFGQYNPPECASSY